METFNDYETMIVLDAGLENDIIATTLEKFKALINSNGEIKSVDEWGKRRLAYPIKHKVEGYYVLIKFTAPSNLPSELERVYRITDCVIRSLVVKKSI